MSALNRTTTPAKGQKLTLQQVIDIHKQLWYTHKPMSEIAKEFGVSGAMISYIARGTNWPEVAKKMVPEDFRNNLHQKARDK